MSEKIFHFRPFCHFRRNPMYGVFSFANEYVLVGTGRSNSYGQDQRISKRIVVASRYPFSILSVAGASSRKHSRTKRNSRSLHAMHGK